MLIDLIRLIYPNCCVSCNKTLVGGEEILCIECLYSIPKASYFRQRDKLNVLLNSDRLINFIALFEFGKNQLIQDLIHRLKYKKERNIGVFLGKKLAEEIKRKELSINVDFIVSVPITQKKKFERGYNQTEILGNELAKCLGRPFVSDLLKKVGDKESQISRSAFRRWENVENRFKLSHSEKSQNTFVGKHLMIVDDVVTTGSTLESCARQLLKIDGCCVSFAVVASA